MKKVAGQKDRVRKTSRLLPRRQLDTDTEPHSGIDLGAAFLLAAMEKSVACSEAVKKSSKVVVTLSRDETCEQLVHHHSTSTNIATFETASIRRTCFVTVIRWSRWHHAGA